MLCILLQFEASFVSFVHTEIAQVQKTHSPSGPEQLNLENGQLILILSKNASGWWLGELQVSVTHLLRSSRCHFKVVYIIQ